MFEASSQLTLLRRSDYATLNLAVNNLSPQYEQQKNAKLKNAKVLEDNLFPDNVVRIGTTITLKDLGSGSKTCLMLVNSSEKRPDQNQRPIRVPVTSMLGVVLLGMRLGDHVRWTLPNGHYRSLRISNLS